MTNMISADNAAILAAKSIAADKLGAAGGVTAAGLTAAQGGKAGLSAEAGDNDRLTAILESLSRSSAETAKALSAVSTRLGSPRGCCCCGNVAVSSRDTVYAVGTDSKNVDGKTIVALTSYHQPITSQAEADAVNVIVYLGGATGSWLYFGGGFTLDGFSMPGDLPIYLQAVDSYPCTFLRKKDGSGWICLTRQDVMRPDCDQVDISIDRTIFNTSGDYTQMQEQMCCGLYEHNCRGKFFTAQISDAKYWTEEQKQQGVSFTIKKDTVFYDTFPENPYPQMEYIPLMVGMDCNSYSATWGELIEKYGDKPFGVRIQVNNNLNGTVFTLN